MAKIGQSSNVSHTKFVLLLTFYFSMCIRVLQRNRPIGYIYIIHIYNIYIFSLSLYIYIYAIYLGIIQNWLMWLWILRSPRICPLQTGDSGDLEVQIPIQVQEKSQVPFQTQSCREQILLYPAFYFIQASYGLDGTHWHWGVPSALLSLLICM